MTFFQYQQLVGSLRSINLREIIVNPFLPRPPPSPPLPPPGPPLPPNLWPPRPPFPPHVMKPFSPPPLPSPAPPPSSPPPVSAVCINGVWPLFPTEGEANAVSPSGTSHAHAFGAVWYMPDDFPGKQHYGAPVTECPDHATLLSPSPPPPSPPPAPPPSPPPPSPPPPIIFVSLSGDEASAALTQTADDLKFYHIEFTGNTVAAGDWVCWQKKSEQTDCTGCQTANRYPDNGGQVAALADGTLQQDIVLDGDIDGAPVHPARGEEASGTFVLCLAQAADVGSQAGGVSPPTDGSFVYFPQVKIYTKHEPPSPPPSPPPPAPPPSPPPPAPPPPSPPPLPPAFPQDDCSFGATTSGAVDVMVCADGTRQSLTAACHGDVGDCCSERGGRWRCPSNLPLMCALNTVAGNCGGGSEYCCVAIGAHPGVCDSTVGLRECDTLPPPAPPAPPPPAPPPPSPPSPLPHPPPSAPMDCLCTDFLRITMLADGTPNVFCGNQQMTLPLGIGTTASYPISKTQGDVVTFTLDTATAAAGCSVAYTNCDSLSATFCVGPVFSGNCPTMGTVVLYTNRYSQTWHTTDPAFYFQSHCDVRSPPPPSPPPSPPSPPPCSGIAIHPVYGTHGKSYGVFMNRITNPDKLPAVDPMDEYVLCVVFERAVILFNPSAEYTGNFVAPWGPTECAGEMHDTFSIRTMDFTASRDGYFEGGFGARRTNNYELYSFPTDGVAFLYHFVRGRTQTLPFMFLATLSNSTRSAPVTAQGIFHINDMADELVNINSASLQGTSNPTKSGADCHPSNANGYCMNFGFYGSCSDSLFFETTTIAPATGDVLTDAYWASSTHARWAGEVQPAQTGYALASEGYTTWLAIQMPPLPPNSAGYPARRLEELRAGTLSQRELHDHRLRIVAEDDWLQSLVPAYGGALGWTNSSLVALLEKAEEEGKPIADRYLHALIPRAPSLPPIIDRRALHVIDHDHPPPDAPVGSPHAPPPPPAPPVGPLTVCPTALPHAYSACGTTVSYDECHYDPVCCALTNDCQPTTHANCMRGGYWALTHTTVVCPEAMSPRSPPTSPPPQLRGMEGGDWAAHVVALLTNPLLGHATTPDDVDVAFDGRELAFCVRPTGADTLDGLLASMSTHTFVPALAGASGAHLFLREPPEVSYAAYG